MEPPSNLSVSKSKTAPDLCDLDFRVGTAFTTEQKEVYLVQSEEAFFRSTAEIKALAATKPRSSM